MADQIKDNFSVKSINGRTAVLQKNADLETKIIEKRMKNQLRAEQKLQSEISKIDDDIRTAKRLGLDGQVKDLEQQLKRKKVALTKAHADTVKQEKAAAAEAAAIAEDAAKLQYERLNALQRTAHQSRIAEELAEERKKYQAMYDAAVAAGDKKAAAEAAAAERAAAEKEKIAKDEAKRLNKATGDLQSKKEFSRAQAEEAKETARGAKSNVKNLKADFSKEDLALQKKIQAAKKSGNKQEVKDLEALRKKKRKDFEESAEYVEAEKEAKEASAEATKASFSAAADEIAENSKKALENVAGNAAKQLTNAIESDMDAMFGDQGRINTRLQGYDQNFTDIVKDIQKNVGMSGLVSQRDVVAKMVELADSGVAYNLEMRAFLASTADNIASTFDVFSSDLARLIRIQQADTTAARMGMEQSLTELFNTYFSDSSYMNKGGAADTVSSSLLGAMSQMSRDDALAFEYTVQKWLGALYSLGLSDEGVSTIAEGINYLGTGNVSALNGNDTLQTLLAMSAARSGKSYSDMLTQGLTAQDTNDLLKSMVNYLAEIAESQDNMVTKAAYSDLLGMTITDLSSFQQLQTAEIDNLYKTNMNYSQMMNKTSSQLNSMITRVNMGKVIDLAIENAMTGASVGIGSNPASYGLWKTINLVESLTGGIDIPAVEVYGFMVDLHTTIEGLMKTGMAGISLIGSLVGSLANGSLFGTMDLSKWGYEDYTTRGAAVTQLFSGSSTSVSESSSMKMSSSGDDMASTSMSDASEDAQSDAGTSSEEMEEGKELNEKIYKAIAANEGEHTVLTVLDSIAHQLRDDRVFYTMGSGYSTSSSVQSILKSSSYVDTLKTAITQSAGDESASLLSNIEAATGISAGAVQSKPDNTLSDVIHQAVVAALLSVAQGTTFKSEVTNSPSDPINVKNVTI